MTSSGPPPHAPLNVVYYLAAAGGRPPDFIRHLCSLGREASFVESTYPTEATLTWDLGSRAVRTHVFIVTTRSTSWQLPMKEASELNDVIPREFEALRQAQVIVFLAGDQAGKFGRTRHFVKMLRADLVALGRNPDEVPVLFQLQHMEEPPAPMAELAQVLVWHRCDRVDAFPKENRGAKEALDRAIELYLETAR